MAQQQTGTPAKIVERAHAFPLEYVQTGPGTLGGQYLRLFWHPVARSQDLGPGRAKAIRILSEDFTLYRGQTGIAHISQHRCPHRKTRLSVGWVEGDSIRIKTYPTQELLGLIYGYFGEGAPPPFPPYPAFDEEGLIEAMVEPFPCNYFQSWENDFDICHANYTHWTGAVHGPNDASRGELYLKLALAEKWEETDDGLVRVMPTMSGAGRNAAICLMPATIRLHIPTFNEQARFPGPRFRPTYLVHTPVDDENHLVFITQVVPVTGTEAEEYNKLYRELIEAHKRQPLPMEIADQVFLGDKSLDDIKDYHLLVGVEDLLTQVGQGAMVDRSDERLGRSDAGVVLLRRLWARELEALRKGRSSKQWAFMSNPPEGLSAEPFLNPSGIAQAGESSGTPTSVGTY